MFISTIHPAKHVQLNEHPTDPIRPDPRYKQNKRKANTQASSLSSQAKMSCPSLYVYIYMQ